MVANRLEEIKYALRELGKIEQSLHIAYGHIDSARFRLIFDRDLNDLEGRLKKVLQELDDVIHVIKLKMDSLREELMGGGSA